ncbi:hypothetical protein [Xanthomonas campestris]|uniref:hypothetical protein n=1 Tax=Xanthomonas campestris TaxID=339 RepID=UPI002365860F|nr:hypothetical protein [Xanthomonas campestris]MEA9711832.1 hypothetical protein [Xanthomonas campestris]MEA9782172.1 hypothetical protein [Xanthomonas campestris pv. raphani]MEA9790047.1 hypothetical protein [Xanthomonas campestris pv. raphani]MEA9801798.1 hypothetical protein [Xanthomonas campestris pv. raphani]MEA9818185.1 hypothetical protein [Xanthomonas campestris pv. raphani]
MTDTTGCRDLAHALAELWRLSELHRANESAFWDGFAALISMLEISGMNAREVRTALCSEIMALRTLGTRTYRPGMLRYAVPVIVQR